MTVSDFMYIYWSHMLALQNNEKFRYYGDSRYYSTPLETKESN